jgi:hypothetical protein
VSYQHAFWFIQAGRDICVGRGIAAVAFRTIGFKALQKAGKPFSGL